MWLNALIHAEYNPPCGHTLIYSTADRHLTNKRLKSEEKPYYLNSVKSETCFICLVYNLPS